MTREKIMFANRTGHSLAAALEMPSTMPRAFALFAHCFTCGKDAVAAVRISRALADAGIAVLRFDFTGLGGSEGDFANAGFASNVNDLVDAAAWLGQAHQSPRLLIGHSLGGTAVLGAAAHIQSCRAVATIGSPADPEHVIGLFSDKVGQIQRDGVARVNLGGREFDISADFVEDLQQTSLADTIAGLDRALLVMHSPVDRIVSIDQATRIFTRARHPKSFFSLDRADHLLTRREDADHAASVLSAWASRYLDQAEPDQHDVPRGAVEVGELNHRFARLVQTDDHRFIADEPASVSGDNLGPDPYELLLSSLGTCTSMTVRMYANRKGWSLDDVRVELAHWREHAGDCEVCENESSRIDILEKKLYFRGDLSAAQRTRLMEIADRCPVHKTLEGDIRITTVDGSTGS